MKLLPFFFKQSVFKWILTLFLPVSVTSGGGGPTFSKRFSKKPSPPPIDGLPTSLGGWKARIGEEVLSSVAGYSWAMVQERARTGESKEDIVKRTKLSTVKQEQLVLQNEENGLNAEYHQFDAEEMKALNDLEEAYQERKYEIEKHFGAKKESLEESKAVVAISIGHKASERTKLEAELKQSGDTKTLVCSIAAYHNRVNPDNGRGILPYANVEDIKPVRVDLELDMDNAEVVIANLSSHKLRLKCNQLKIFNYDMSPLFKKLSGGLHSDIVLYPKDKGDVLGVNVLRLQIAHLLYFDVFKTAESLGIDSDTLRTKYGYSKDESSVVHGPTPTNVGGAGTPDATKVFSPDDQQALLDFAMKSPEVLQKFQDERAKKKVDRKRTPPSASLDRSSINSPMGSIANYAANSAANWLSPNKGTSLFTFGASSSEEEERAVLQPQS